MRTDRALAALRDLCAARLGVEALVPALLETLHTLVPSQRNLFDRTDARGRLMQYWIEGPVDTAIAGLYFSEFHNRRETEVMPAFESLAHQPAGVRGAAELEHAAFYRSALYNEIWRPQQLHSRLEAVLRGPDGALLGSLVLYRGPGDPRFTRNDEQRLTQVLAPLAAAISSAGGPLPAAERHVPAPEPPETLLLALDGTLRHASAGAFKLLWQAEGGIRPGHLDRSTTPPGRPLLGLLLSRLRESGAGPTARGQGLATPACAAAAAATVTHTTPAGQLLATATLLAPVPPPGPAPGAALEPLVHVSLRRLEPHRVALERALRRLPLTAGQAAVCREVHAGRTHAEIATRLGVAPATVVDHVRKLYRSLALRNTHELRARLESEIASL